MLGDVVSDDGAAPSGGASRSGPFPTRPGAVVTNDVRPGEEKKTALDGTWTSAKSGEKIALYLYRGAAAQNSFGFCTGTRLVAVPALRCGHRRHAPSGADASYATPPATGWKLAHWDEYTAGLNTEDPPEAAHLTIDNRLGAAVSLAEQTRQALPKPIP